MFLSKSFTKYSLLFNRQCFSKSNKPKLAAFSSYLANKNDSTALTERTKIASVTHKYILINNFPSNSFTSKLPFKANFHTSHYKQYPSCELTANRYAVTRGQYSKVTESDVSFFKSVLEEHRVITAEDELKGSNTDWLGMVRGYSSLLLKPKTTEEVSKIISYCNEKNLAVCPQGGNTGLVGGSVPVFDEIIISTSLMNKVESVDEYSGAVICQSGCVLEFLDQYVSQYGLLMPLDLGAKGSCQIGGNVSTNAGGLRLLRYGSLQGSVLGVEAVLASGQIIDCLSAMKKDNTGYGLKHLFIGSEGTLGFVTKVSIHCPTRPTSSSVAFLGLEKFDDVLQTFQKAKTDLGEILSSCEFIDEDSIESVRSHLKLTVPIDKQKFYMLVETSGSNASHDEEKLTNFLEGTLQSGIVVDGTVATEPSKMLEMWAIRERIAEALLHDGYAYKYDISLPLPVFYEVVERMQERLKGHVTRCCGYGHVGDGNLHLNVTTSEYDKNVLDLIEPFIFEITSKYKGSISAEHGLGFKKKNFMSYSRSASSIALMKQLKNLMDPKGILNPYKVLPEE